MTEFADLVTGIFIEQLEISAKQAFNQLGRRLTLRICHLLTPEPLPALKG